MPSKTQSILLGGVVVGILSTSYLGFINFLCCAGVIIGAMVAVWHYTGTYALTIPAGQGAAIGALAAVVGALLALLFNWLLDLAGLPGMEEIQRSLMERIAPPEQLEQMERMQEQQRTSPMLIVAVALFSMAIYAVFGAIGGAIGAALFKRGEQGPGATERPF